MHNQILMLERYGTCILTRIFFQLCELFDIIHEAITQSRHVCVIFVVKLALR